MSRAGEKFIGLTVCVNYADLLEITASTNKSLFDYWVIATDKFDDETYILCQEKGIHCVKTNAFYNGGAKFNKARVLNGLIEQFGGKDDWYCTVDADIILNEGYPKTNLDPAKLYTLTRYDCYSKKMLDDFYKKGYDSLVLPDEKCYTKEGHKIPIGYFFMWKGKKYFNESWDASKYDIHFSMRWKPDKWIYGNNCIHLCDSIRADFSQINWEGRRTKRFK